jgi:outer membrane usher protein
MRDAGSIERVSLSASLALSRDCNLLVSGGRSRHGAVAGFEAFAGASYSLPGGAIGSLSYERASDGGGSTSVNLQKSLPLGTGFGYQVNASDGGGGAAGGRGIFQYQSPYGRYEAFYQRVNGQGVGTLSASGGIVAIGGTIFPTRPVGQGFALLRVPGVEGVTGFSSNQTVGRTNARGDLLIPEILPYYGNRIGIADTDVPIDYEIGATEKNVAPPYRGGSVILFPVQRLRVVTGSLLLEITGQIVVPAYGRLTLSVGGKKLELPIGSGGDFYLEYVDPGLYVGTVEFGAASCEFAIEVPRAQLPFVNLGTLRCRVGAP